jgi:hypothetical protein
VDAGSAILADDPATRQLRPTEEELGAGHPPATGRLDLEQDKLAIGGAEAEIGPWTERARR